MNLVKGRVKRMSKGVKLSSSEFSRPPSRNLFLVLLNKLLWVLRECLGLKLYESIFKIQYDIDKLIVDINKECVGFTCVDKTQDYYTYICLDTLLDSLRDEAKLTRIGEIMAMQKIRNALRNRLLLRHYIGLHPEVQNEAVDDPIVITGFPRSGTTLLHRSLTKTGHFQFLTLRDTLYPMIPETNIYHFCSQYLFSKLQSIHDCSLDSPEEETILMDMCFASQLTPAMYHVPRYIELLRTLTNVKETVFQIETYNFLKNVLQVHQHRARQRLPGDSRRWLLKSPTHIDSLPTLLSLFPKAQLIFCKRDIYQCLLSTISATAHARRVFSDSVEMARVSEYWCAKFISMNQKLAAGQCSLYSVEYGDLVTDLDRVLAELQKRLGYEAIVVKTPTQKGAQGHRQHHHYESQHLHLPKYLPFLPDDLPEHKDSDSGK